MLDTLTDYHWPGNIRELENLVQRSLIMSPGRTLVLGDWLRGKPSANQKAGLMTVEETERAHMTAVLEKTHWKVSGENGAARLLDMIPTTLDSRMRKLGIKRPASITS